MGVNGDAGASSTDDIGGGLTSAGVLIALGPLFFCFFFFAFDFVFVLQQWLSPANKGASRPRGNL